MKINFKNWNNEYCVTPSIDLILGIVWFVISTIITDENLSLILYTLSIYLMTNGSLRALSNVLNSKTKDEK